MAHAPLTWCPAVKALRLLALLDFLLFLSFAAHNKLVHMHTADKLQHTLCSQPFFGRRINYTCWWDNRNCRWSSQRCCCCLRLRANKNKDFNRVDTLEWSVLQKEIYLEIAELLNSEKWKLWAATKWKLFWTNTAGIYKIMHRKEYENFVKEISNLNINRQAVCCRAATAAATSSHIQFYTRPWHKCQKTGNANNVNYTNVTNI